MLSFIGLHSAKSSFQRCPSPYNSPDLFGWKNDEGVACIMSGNGGRLYKDESITNGNCTLTMQGDGNLILWRSGTVQPSWSTGTGGHQVSASQGFFGVMQPDANLVVYLYEENVPESENIAVFATNTDQDTQVAELWMSDGSQGYCRLYILGNRTFEYDSVLTTEFNTILHQRPYLYKSQILYDIGGTYSMTLQHDCNLVVYSERYGDLADVDVSSDLVWAAGYSYQGNDKDCVFTQETDGTFSIYLISEIGEWDKVWSYTKYLYGFDELCTWWRTRFDSDGLYAECD